MMGTLSALSVGISGQSQTYFLTVSNVCFQTCITMVWLSDHSHSVVTFGFFLCVWWRRCSTHAWVAKGWRRVSSPFLTEVLSLNLRLIHLGWQARKPQASVCPTSSALRLQMHASVFSFYMNDRNPDSGTHTDMANISPTKSAPAPSSNSILENDLPVHDM